MGKTIVVTFGEPTLAGGIEVYPGAIYLYPTDSGAWNLKDFNMSEDDTSYQNLESAVRAAHEYVAVRERELRESAKDHQP